MIYLLTCTCTCRVITCTVHVLDKSSTILNNYYKPVYLIISTCTVYFYMHRYLYRYMYMYRLSFMLFRWNSRPLIELEWYSCIGDVFFWRDAKSSWICHEPSRWSMGNCVREGHPRHLLWWRMRGNVIGRGRFFSRGRFATILD